MVLDNPTFVISARDGRFCGAALAGAVTLDYLSKQSIHISSAQINQLSSTRRLYIIFQSLQFIAIYPGSFSPVLKGAVGFSWLEHLTQLDKIWNPS
jgi:hypothetical protein